MPIAIKVISPCAKLDTISNCGWPLIKACFYETAEVLSSAGITLALIRR
jgi:hypothetical protein